MTHYGVTCDGCGIKNFAGVRYKCQSCFDYDLCHNCMINGVTSKQHQTSHGMKSIGSPPGELDLYFGDAPKKKKKPVRDESESESSDSAEDEDEEEEEEEISPRDVLGTGEKTYACPYCARIGYTEQLLVNHVVNDHAEEDKPVVCPVCAARPGGNPNYVSRDFHGHIDLRHGGGRAKKGFTSKTKAKKGHTKGVRGRGMRRSGSSELGLSAEKSNRDKRGKKKGDDFEGPLFEQAKTELTAEEKESQYHSQMMRAIFMQQMIFSTLLPEDS